MSKEPYAFTIEKSSRAELLRFFAQYPFTAAITKGIDIEVAKIARGFRRRHVEWSIEKWSTFGGTANNFWQPMWKAAVSNTIGPMLLGSFGKWSLTLFAKDLVVSVGMGTGQTLYKPDDAEMFVKVARHLVFGAKKD